MLIAVLCHAILPVCVHLSYIIICVFVSHVTVCSKDFLQFTFGGRGYQDQLHDSIAKTKALAGVKVELLTLRPEGQEEGRGQGQMEMEMVWVTHNFAFLGGSLGCAEGEKIARAFEYASQHKVTWCCGAVLCCAALCDVM